MPARMLPEGHPAARTSVNTQAEIVCQLWHVQKKGLRSHKHFSNLVTISTFQFAENEIMESMQKLVGQSPSHSKHVSMIHQGTKLLPRGGNLESCSVSEAGS